MGIIGICVRVTALLVLVMATSTTGWAQSQLPPCPEKEGVYRTNCFGALTDADGRKYVGEWRDDKRHGRGTFTYISGDKYVGEYSDGERRGQGVWTGANGEKYVGEWRDDKANGLGTLYSPQGAVLKNGIWRDGKLVAER